MFRCYSNTSFKEISMSVYLYFSLANHKQMQRRDHTTHAKTNAVANTDPPKPSWNPTAAARAVTVAE